MSDGGFYDELPEDVMARHERTARNLANLWADGCEAARQGILVALCEETLRVSRSMAASATLPVFRPPSDPS